MRVILFYTIILSVAVSSCSEREIIIPPFEPIISDRVVLVEEVTGVRCPNCPSGSAKIESVIEQFPGQVIAVGIHGSFLTAPYGESKYDFRNDPARDLENYLKPWEGKPAAYVNRKKFENEALVSISEFDLISTYVAQELNEAHVIEISVGTSYDSTTRDLEVNLGVIPLVDLSGDFRLHVMLTESHIIDRQANVGEVIEAYEHNHVLRAMMTAFDGDPYATSFTSGELTNASFTFTLPQEDGTWIAENMEVIAFISKQDDNQGEILQASSFPVISN